MESLSASKASSRQRRTRHEDDSKPSTARSSILANAVTPWKPLSDLGHDDTFKSIGGGKQFSSTNSPLNAPPNTVRRIPTREREMATPAPTNVCPVIIKTKIHDKVDTFRGHNDNFKKKLSTKDKAMRASRRMVVLKDLLKLKILNTAETRSLMRQDYYKFGKAFKKMDTNGDGVVDYNELAAALGPHGMNIGLKEGELYHLAREFDHDANGSIDIEEFFHTLADLDAPDKNLTLIMAESKQAELDTYTTKLENIRKLNMKKFKSRKGRSFMVEDNSDCDSSISSAQNCTDRIASDHTRMSGTPAVSPLKSSRSTGRLRRQRRIHNHGSVSLPALHSSRLLETSKFVTGEGHSNPGELDPLNKEPRQDFQRKIWPVRQEDAGQGQKHHADSMSKTILNDVSTRKKHRLEGSETFYPGAVSGKRMYCGCNTLNSQFRIEAPDAPPTMESWKRTSTPTWKKAHHSKRKGAEVFIPILRERYAKRDDISYKKYQSRIKGRVKSRYNYLIGLFENEMALEALKTRGNKKGMLGSDISKRQQRGQMGLLG